MPSLWQRTLNRLGLATVSDVDQWRQLAISERGRRHASGVPVSGTTDGSSFSYEANTKLKGNALWTTLDEMENDPHVKAALRTNTLPLLTEKWDIQPGGDDRQDELIRNFCAANLLRETNDDFGPEVWCLTSWNQRLAQDLRALRDGFSMSAYTTRRVGTFKCYDRIHWLEPSSVDPQGWVIDDFDNLIRVKRTYQRPSGRYEYRDPLTVDQIFLKVWEMIGARFTGRPLVRSMYGAWYRKDKVQRWRAIYAQKIGCPVPVAHYPSNLFNDPGNRSDLEDFVKSGLRGMSPTESFGIFPKSGDDKTEFEYVGAQHAVERGLTDITDAENREIGHAGGTSSEMLGETESGSRALGSSKQRREMMMVQAVAIWLKESIEHGTANVRGEIERLVDMNWPGVRRYPQLITPKIDPDEGIAVLDKLPPLVNAGIVPKHEELRRQVTERLGFQLPDEAYEMEPPPAIPSPTPAGQPPLGQPDSVPDPDDSEDQAAASALELESADDFKARIASLLAPVEGAPVGSGFRAPNRLELEFVALQEVREAFRIGERDAMMVLREVRRAMTDDLMGRFRAGKITPRNLEGMRRSAFKRARWARNRLRIALRSAGQLGVEHVDEEVGRQGATDAAA